jgi:hypothetical protein
MESGLSLPSNSCRRRAETALLTTKLGVSPRTPDGILAGATPADLSTPAVGSGSRSVLTQPIGRFAGSRGPRFDGAMKIIEHRGAGWSCPRPTASCGHR